MNTKSVPSLYRKVMPRLSTLAVSTLVPALNVRSTTLPVSTFFSVVRTNAPPLPGLTCWNSTTAQSWPSMLRTRPFLRSLVLATTVYVSCRTRRLARWCESQPPSLAGPTLAHVQPDHPAQDGGAVAAGGLHAHRDLARPAPVG